MVLWQTSLFTELCPGWLFSGEIGLFYDLSSNLCHDKLTPSLDIPFLLMEVYFLTGFGLKLEDIKMKI